MSNITKAVAVNVPGIYKDLNTPLIYMLEFAKKRIAALYEETVGVFNNSFGRSTACAICVDYIPLSIFSALQNNSRQLYGSVVSDQGVLRVNFRARPVFKLMDKEVPLTGVLNKFIFNYDAIRSILNFISSNQDKYTESDIKDLYSTIISLAVTTLKLREFYIGKFDKSIVSQISKDKQFENGFEARNEIFREYANIATLYNSVSQKQLSAKDGIEEIKTCLENIQAEIESLNDSVYDLAVYASLTEVQAMHALLALCGSTDALAAYIDNISSSVHCIKDVGAITLNTLTLSLLKTLQQQTEESICDIIKNNSTQAISDMLGSYCGNNGVELHKLYDRHMFVANYELMHLNKSSAYAPKNIQGIHSRFSEYVPLMTKFDQVYNPLFDKELESNEVIFEYLFDNASKSLKEDLLCLTISNNDLVLMNYADYLSYIENSQNQDSTMRLYEIMIPCDYFDSLANKYFILPAFKNIIEEEIIDKSMTLQFSAYMSETIVTAWLQNLGLLFDRADSIMSGNKEVGRYYFNEEQGPGTLVHTPCAIQMLHEFGAYLETSLNGGDHFNNIGFFDVLLYKLLLAAGKKPVGISMIRADLDFGSWLVSSIKNFGGNLDE